MPWITQTTPKPKKAPVKKKAVPKRKAKAMPKIKKPARRKHVDVPVEFYDAPGVPPMFNHQGETRDHLLNVPCTYDASDPGTGKTRSEVEAWAARRRAGGGCLLVLCPKSIMQVAWGDDIDKFFPLEFTYVVANAANRERAFNDEVDIYITNLDAVKWLDKQPNKFFDKFDELVVDEATAYKNPSSARSKAAARVKDHFFFRRLLCGTPMPKGVIDMWHQMYLVDDGARLGQSYYKFRTEMCDVVQVGPRPEHRQWRDKENASTIVAGLISDVTVRHKFEDCVEIPPNVQRKIFYDLTPAHRKIYNQMKEHAIIEAKGESVQAGNAAVLAGKLIQIASGSVYSSAGNEIALFPERVQLVMELVKERAFSIVFFNWQHQLAELKKLADKEGITYESIHGSVPDKKRDSIVRGFQAGDYQTLFLQPESAAHGLTLTRATASIWASPTYRPDIMRQGLARCYRAGQEFLTENIMICARNTADEKVFSVMEGKDIRMQELLEFLE
jgi:SNF2 family DNA or RNA helicase